MTSTQILLMLALISGNASAQITGSTFINLTRNPESKTDRIGAEIIALYAKNYGYDVVRENGVAKGYWLDNSMPIVSGRPIGKKFEMFTRSTIELDGKLFSDYIYGNQNLGRASFMHGHLGPDNINDAAPLGERLLQLGKAAKVYVDPEMYILRASTLSPWESLTPPLTENSRFWNQQLKTFPEMEELIRTYAPVNGRDFRPALVFADPTKTTPAPPRFSGKKSPCIMTGPYESAAALGEAKSLFDDNVKDSRDQGMAYIPSLMEGAGRTLNQMTWGAAYGTFQVLGDTSTDVMNVMQGRRAAVEAEVPNSLFRGWGNYFNSIQPPNLGQPFLNLGPGA